VQVRDQLEDAIRREHYAAGAQLPSEHELAERYAVGRSTIREALRLLERDGIVDVVHGRGRFVSALAQLRAERPITEFESVTEMLTGLGYSVRNCVLRVAQKPAGEEHATALGLRVGRPTIVLERVRLHEDEPLIYSINVLDRRLVPEPLETVAWDGSVLELLRARGANVVSSAATIRAATLPEEAQTHVGEHARVPWLCITEICITDDGRAVLHATDYHRADVFAFHVVRQRAAAAPRGGQKARKKA
jgi:GntR family transcriptional regulator